MTLKVQVAEVVDFGGLRWKWRLVDENGSTQVGSGISFETEQEARKFGEKARLEEDHVPEWRD